MLRASTDVGCELTRLLQDRSAGLANFRNKLLRESIKLGNAAGGIIKESTDSAVSAAVLIEELDERLLSARTVVLDRLSIRGSTLREELDRREGADAVLGREGTVVLRVSVDIRDEAL